MAVDIRSFLDYRSYLRAWFLDADGDPSQASFAAIVGCARSQVNQILTGSRALPPTAVSEWARALGLDAEGASYLAALVDRESEVRAHREAAQRRIRTLRAFWAAVPFDESALVLYQGEAAAILELATCVAYIDDPGWIASRFDPPLDPDDVSRILARLADAGLLKTGEEPGRPQIVATAPEVPFGLLSDALAAWYREVFAEAPRRMDEVPPAERHLAALTLAVPSSMVPTLKERLTELEHELGALCSQTTARDRVYRLVIGLVPIART